jgi:hypothetical protein
MTIPILFDFAESAIVLLSITAFTLAFVFMYVSEQEEAS